MTFFMNFMANSVKILKSFLGHKREVEETTLTCPKCKEHKLVIRLGKAGEFAGCAGFPKCKFTSNFIREEDESITLVEPEKPKTVDITCPQCGKKT